MTRNKKADINPIKHVLSSLPQAQLIVDKKADVLYQNPAFNHNLTALLGNEITESVDDFTLYGKLKEVIIQHQKGLTPGDRLDSDQHVFKQVKLFKTRDFILDSLTIKFSIHALSDDLFLLSITHLNRGEETHSLSLSELNHFREIINYYPEHVILINPHGDILEVNNEACSLFGYTRGEFKNLTVNDIVGKSEQQLSQRRLDTLFTEGLIHFETKHVSKDGNHFDSNVFCRCLNYGGVVNAIAYIRRINRPHFSAGNTDLLLHESLEQFSNCTNEEQLSKMFVELVFKLQPDAIVFYSQLVNENKEVELAALKTNNKLINTIEKLWKRQFVGTRGEIHPNFYELKSRGLIAYQHGGLDSMASNMISRGISKLFEKATGYSVVHGLGIKCDGKMHGALGIIIPQDSFILKPKTIESLGAQVEFCIERLQSIEALKASDLQFRDFLSGLPEFVFEIKVNGDFVYVNDEAKNRFPILKNTAKTINVFNFLPKPQQQKLHENIASILKGKSLRGNEYGIDYEGMSYQLKMFSNPIFEEGKVVAIRGIAFDVSRENHLRAELQEATDSYAEIFNEVNDGILQVDKHGVILNINNKLCEILNVERANLINRNAIELAPKILDVKSLPVILKNMHMCLKGEPVKNMRVKVHSHWLEISASQHPETKNIIAVVHEFTDLQHAKAELEVNEKRYKALYKEAPIPYQSLDKNAIILDVNPKWLKTLGYKRDVVLGKHFSDFIHPDARDSFMLKFSEFCQRGFVSDVDLPLLKSDGSVLNCLFDGSVLFDEYGGVKQTFGVFRDVTEQRRVEAQVKESEAVIRAIYENLPIGTCIINQNSEIEYVNESLLQITGFEKDELIGNPCHKLCQEPKNCPIFKNKTHSVINLESQLTHKSGKTIHVLKSYRPILINEEIKYLININDVSELLETKLENQRYEVHLDSLYRLGFSNSQSKEELLNEALLDAAKYTNSSVGAIVLFDAEKRSLSFQMQLVKGQLISPKPGMKNLDIAESGMLRKSLESCEPIAYNDYGKLRIGELGKKGLPNFHENVNSLVIVPIVYEDTPQGLIMLGNKPEAYTEQDLRKVKLQMDIVWKMVVQKQQHEELIIAKKRAEESDRTKSAFLANMSHEIRTPMNGILGFTDLLAEIQHDEEQTEYIEMIQKNGKQLLNLINDILDLSKIEANQISLTHSHFSLADVLYSLFKNYENQIDKDRVTLHFDGCPESLSQIYSDEQRILQIISNFLFNAVKFTAEGEIHLGVLANGDYAEIYVSDTGIGMDDIQQEKVFNRFYQVEEPYTKQYAGAGLGLSICNQLAKLLGGDITLRSESKKGSRFALVFPLSSVVKN
ncbi:MAG: PAS domain S-box protein [Bacteroidales bacterium]|jgi:PAS domain S-box-containing protein|nr:PAS domain S-box protein [Bacteroidales bacterium]